MTTAADLVAETKRHLLSGQREALNKLAADVTSSATDLTFTYDVSGMQAGSQVQLGLEVVHVWAVDTASKTITVERGQLGSVATSHTADALATVNPRFPDFTILQSINYDLADLSAPTNGLYVMREVDLTFVGGASGYDFNAPNLLEVHEVRHRIGPASMYRQWPVLTNYEVAEAVNATDFPSGYALFLSETGANGQPLRVQYRASFGSLSSLSDDVETATGLPEHLHDLPSLGAAIRLVAPREIRRNQVEAAGDSRRAEEVPPGAIAASVRNLMMARSNRIAAEAGRLAQQYPDRGFIPQPTYSLRGSRVGSRWGSRW